MKPSKQTSSDHSWDAGAMKAMAKPVSVGSTGSIAASDFDYVQDCRAFLKRQKSGFRGWVPLLAFMLVGLLIWWASWAEVEEVTRGVGKVIPSKSVQLIQSLEGGILGKIHVTEGQQVEKGEPLINIRDAIFLAHYEENCARRNELKARLIRHEAEANGLAALVFSKEINSDLIDIEGKLFEKRKHDFETTKRSLGRRLKLAKDEEKMLLLARKSKAVSPIELIRIQKEVAGLEGELETQQSLYQREAMEKYENDSALVSALEHAINRDKDRLDRTTVRSPVKGTVNKIYINTVGRVIASGEDIMTIVPLDDSLLIEANIRPSDIAFIHPDLRAMVKFTAYDFAVFGGLIGKVEHMSVDTITNDKDESFYQIKIRTFDTSLGQDKRGQEMAIIPGMVTEVDIVTGKKTILSYMLKPLTRARERALRER